MNDDRLLLDVRTWLNDEDVAVPDPEQAGRLVAARLPQTRQLRRKWWPLLILSRTASPPTTDQTTEFQPAPIPTTNGQSSTVTGRTQSMFSPVKAITAGVIVFALGGMLLIAQPFDQQGGVPGAATEAIAPTWVTGTVQPASSCSGPDVVLDGDVTHEWNIECSPQTWTSSDPRFTGEVVRRWNYDVYQTDEGSIEINMDAAYLRNDDGDWACSSSDLLRGSGSSSESLPGSTFTHTCIGGGGYEGLSAILESEDGPANTSEFVGLVFSGDFPPLPEAPAVE